MNGWLLHGVDAVLVVTLLEAAALLAYHRRTGKGLAPRDFVANLLAGLCLMLALRAALAAAPVAWAAAALVAAGAAHAADLRIRAAGRRAGARR